jgi:mono/diheme cytochrome c family protein
LMTRPPVHAPARENQLSFPLDRRFVIAGWKLLFLRHGTYQPDTAQSAEWNRGAYLVEGLAHCGACHTPRNSLGAEQARAQFAGADVENWYAYAINGQSPAPVPWDADALYSYLRLGWQDDHGVARGPMAEVVANLSSVPDSDIRAIATYMASVLGAPTQERKRRADEVLAQANSRLTPAPSSAAPAAQASNPGAAGASIYAATCAVCHETDRALPYGGINLALSTALSSPDARNAANIILSGVRPKEGERGPIMPGFAAGMSNDQVAALLTYLRARFSDQPAWVGVAATVADARQAQTVSLQTLAASPDAPADATKREKP